MATPEGRAAARRTVMGEMSARGWNPAHLADTAGIDYGTVGDFLNGKRWPKLATLGRIDTALGWTPGTLAALGEELSPAPTPTVHALPSGELVAELARRLGVAITVDDDPADLDLSTP